MRSDCPASHANTRASIWEQSPATNSFPGAATKQLPNPKPRWLASQFQGGGPHKGRFFAEAIADKGFRSTIHAAAGSPHTPVEHKPFYEQVASYAKAAQSYLETFYPGVFQ